jgi:hypothetical protein
MDYSSTPNHVYSGLLPGSTKPPGWQAPIAQTAERLHGKEKV